MILSRWLSSVIATKNLRRNSRSASRLPACIDVLEDRRLLSAGSLVTAELATTPGIEFQQIDYNIEFTAGLSTFSEFGVFQFDADGTVDGIAPGEAGFEDAVLNSSSRQILLDGNAVLGDSFSLTFPGGTRLGVYVCQDNPLTDIAQEEVNAFATAPNLQQVGWEESAPIWEDVSFIGPRRFDDAVFTITNSDPQDSPVGSARLTIFVDGDAVTLPANIGVQAGGSMERVFTQDSSGQIIINPIGEVTLGEFFDIWRTNAGLAGNNPDAFFDDDQLLDNMADAESTVQMFVNGEINRDFDDYIVQADDEIVLVFGSNPVVSMNTNFGSIVIELFPDATPITVDNFLNYVNGTTTNGGSYDDTFFHRSDPGFVIQGGGFTTPSEVFSGDSNQFGDVVTDPEIQNEPGLSNLRGTIAMARVGGQVNSADSQFFFNLSDTNSFLDNVDEGFTVFGQVLDLITLDRIEDVPIDETNPPPFAELPVTADNELVVVESFAGQGSLTGVKFNDANGDGDQDAGELGIAGVRIYIDANNNGVFDAGETSTTTDSNGRYLLQATPGQAIVRAELTTGATQTAPADAHVIDVLLGRVFADLDFGEMS